MQIGTPQELYMNPANIFAAHFIGESNFLEGYAASVEDGEKTIELREGVRVQARNNGVKKGDRVILAVRPETFSIKHGEGSKVNSLKGAVEKVTFEGTNIRYEIELENEDSIVVVKPSMIEEWFKEGEKVTVSFPPEKAHTFAYPDKGLKEEIAVE
jgi:ABC-type Fe3+/spermidine/putrescine transport system ATPase subunit